MIVTRQFWFHFGFHCLEKKILWRSIGTKTVSLPTFFKISSFLFCRWKKFIQVWNEMRVS